MVERTYKSNHKNSFSIGNLDRKTRKVINLRPSRKVSSENKGESVVELHDISVKESNEMNNYVPDNRPINESKITERNNSQNFTDNCLITQRINQYLTSVINEQDLQKFQENDLQKVQENDQICRKRQECAEKSDSSRTISPNLLQHNSTSRKQDREHMSRQKSIRQHPRNRNRYSRKNYSEDFEDFRKELDDDFYKLGKTQKGDYHHEKCNMCDEEKGKTSDQVILRILPRTHDREDNKSTEIGHRENQNHSTKRNKFRKRSQPRKVSKSKNAEASSIWTYL